MPLLLREAMSNFGEHAIDNWWSTLNEQARADVLELWYTSTNGGAGTAHVFARIVDPQESQDDPDFWHSDLYEYLVGHELEFAKPRVFHVCTAHPLARKAVSHGLIPGNFQCPILDENCPMKRILDYTGGKSVRLSITFTPFTACSQ